MLDIIIVIAAITVMVILPVVIGLALNSIDEDYYLKKDSVGKCTMEDYYLADRLAR
ncbi:MAG: hypothetical protein PHX62_06455 [Bacilli bacterium]|nr:hypothetical protein [Bacilli bacterium]